MIEISKIVLLIIGIAMVGGLVYLTAGNRLFQPYSILSVSDVSYVESDPTLNGPTWLIHSVATGDSEIVGKDFGILADTSGENAGDVSNYSFSISIKNTKNECFYTLSPSATYLYKYQSQGYGTVYESNGDSACINRKNTVDAKGQTLPANAEFVKAVWRNGWSLLIPTGNIDCLWKYPVARMSEVGTPVLSWSTDISMTSRGQTVNATLTDKNDQDVYLGDKAYIETQGLLWKGTLCPIAGTQSGSSALYDEINKAYVMVNQNGILTYQSKEPTMIQEWTDQIYRYNNPDAARGKITTFNGQVDSVISSIKPLVASDGSQAVMSSDGIRIALNKAIASTSLTIKVKASWIGIIVPVGEPKIVSSIDCKKITAGATGTIKASVQNVGKQGATFVYGAECPAPFASGPSGEQFLAPNEVKELSVTFTQPQDKELTQSCSFFVYPKSYPQKKVTGSVDCSSSRFGKNCTPDGIQQCISNVIQTCIGGEWSLTKACPLGCEANPSTQVLDCKGNQSTCPEGMVKNDAGECVTGGGGFNIPTWLLLVIIAVIAAILIIAYNLLKKR